jgi:hypothetical protein
VQASQEGRPLGASDRVGSPLAGHALEAVEPAILELQAGSGDQVLHGARDQHLTGRRLRRYPGPDVNGDASDLAVHDLALTRVEAGTNLEAPSPERRR